MDDFIKVSKNLGENILLVQGAGGNNSIKIKNKLIIKSSGLRMKEMRIDNGYSISSYKILKKFILSKKRYSKNDEEEFIKLIDLSLSKEKNSNQPSMEIGFHAVITSIYIFHLHSVYANVFLCMENGEKILTEIFKDNSMQIVNYINPGYKLSFYLSRIKNIPKIIFLKNHGIIIHSNSLEECLGLIFLINIKLENYLKENNLYIPFKVLKENKNFKKYLFPDSAVFSKTFISSLNEKKKKDILEIKSAQVYIIDVIKKQKFNPVFLKSEDVKLINGMEQEKKRLKKE